MDEEDKKTLRQIAAAVDRIAKTVTTPKPLVVRILEMVAIFAGAAGIIAIADTIVGWFR
jgi:hypothetical protein